MKNKGITRKQAEDFLHDLNQRAVVFINQIGFIKEGPIYTFNLRNCVAVLLLDKKSGLVVKTHISFKLVEDQENME